MTAQTQAQTQELTVYEGQAVVTRQAAPVSLFGTDDPGGIVARAAAIAKPLAAVIEQQKLAVKIGSGRHVTIGGWTLLGSMLGVYPITVWCRRIEYDGATGWEARVEARTRDGAVVGAAEAQCMDNEENWGRSRSDNQRRSMAQTRAAGKALRLPLGFVIQIAGYAATPYEEMDAESYLREERTEPHSRVSPPAATRTQAARPRTQVAAAPAPSNVSVAPNAAASVGTLRALRAAGEAVGLEVEDIRQAATERYGRGPKELSEHEAQSLVAEFRRMAASLGDEDSDSDGGSDEGDGEQVAMAIEGLAEVVPAQAERMPH